MLNLFNFIKHLFKSQMMEDNKVPPIVSKESNELESMTEVNSDIINSLTNEIDTQEYDLHVKFIRETSDSTISELYVKNPITNKLEYFCYVLEDGHNEPKIWGETRISHGLYPLKKRYDGKHFNNYKPRFGHSCTFMLDEVPNFKWIMIHIGNTIFDTQGCLLVGYSYHLNNMENVYAVRESTSAYLDLYDRLVKLFKEKESLVIFIDRRGSKKENIVSL